ncbi:MAG: hypothetical protein OXC80_14495 [Gammaproteobacteria bacterium]|nr:hypothetical protein [Gammaproteobacteria bacterium]
MLKETLSIRAEALFEELMREMKMQGSPTRRKTSTTISDANAWHSEFHLFRAFVPMLQIKINTAMRPKYV